MAKGSCLCGAVRVEVAGELVAPEACHCSMCRKQSGHFWASTDVPRERVTIEGAENLTWFRSSGEVRRGFCATCGSFLFWERVGAARVEIAMGAFEAPTGTRLARHIFVADEGDYCDVGDGLPQNPQ